MSVDRTALTDAVRTRAGHMLPGSAAEAAFVSMWKSRPGYALYSIMTCPLKSDVPDEVGDLVLDLYRRLPEIRII